MGAQQRSIPNAVATLAPNPEMSVDNATAPAPIMLLTRKYRSKGPLTDTLLPLVGMDDAVGIVERWDPVSEYLFVSTNSDFYSGITSAIGTLKGNLHGGANEAAYEFLENIKSKEEANEIVKKILKIFSYFF